MIPQMIFDILFPFFRKERINFHSELESQKIEYRKLKKNIKEKEQTALELAGKDKKKIDLVKIQFKKELKSLKRVFKDTKANAKINFMSSVSSNKQLRETVKLSKKSKSNIHQILFQYSKLPYEEKKNSLVVFELSPSKEMKVGIKKRVFDDLNAFNDKANDRIYAAEKDIIFTSITFGNGVEKIPVVLRYSGQCVPIFLSKLRDDNNDKFSSENEHHIMLLSERLREIKAPKGKMKMGKMMFMIILIAVIGGGYLFYKYQTGGA